MGLSAEQSARNADARIVLRIFYQHRPRGGGITVVSFPRGEEIDGLSYERLTDGAERLLRLGWAKRQGALQWSVTPEGVDAHESPDDLEQALPVQREAPVVPPPEFRNVSPEVAAALSDARASIERGEPANAIDRVHTVVHKRLLEICQAHSLPVEDNAPTVAIFKILWSTHPEGPKTHEQSQRIMRSLGSVLESLNDLRNNASLAHGRELPDTLDALLAIDVAHTIARYVEQRFGTK